MKREAILKNKSYIKPRLKRVQKLNSEKATQLDMSFEKTIIRDDLSIPGNKYRCDFCGKFTKSKELIVIPMCGDLSIESEKLKCDRCDNK